MPDSEITQQTIKPHRAISALWRLTVSAPFRREVFRSFPQLEGNAHFQTLFWYLLFGGWHDDDTHRLLLCADILSSIEGRNYQNTEAAAFLDKFNSEVLLPNGAEMLWTEWYFKKCRQLRRLNLGSFQDSLREEQFGAWDLDGLVYLDGTRFNPKKQRALRMERQREANRLPALCDDAKNIRAYLNGLSPNLFTGLVNRNLQTALTIAREIPKADVRDAQLRILRHIKAQPQPFYFPSSKGHTVRLSTSEAIPNLKSSVRRALTADWLDADLRCSQLAICSHLWNIKPIAEFLESGESVWGHLCDAISLPVENRSAAKPILKKALYSICYGMQERCAQGLTAKGFVIEDLDKAYAGRLLSVPIVKDLFVARNAQLARVEREGGAHDYYGQWCPVTAERQARDILAEVSQSWEMRLIAPAFNLARSTDEFTIGLFQHDGFSVHFSKRTDVERVMRLKQRIQDAVDNQARTMGIQTRIEWEKDEARKHGTEGRRHRSPFISPFNDVYSEKRALLFQKPSCGTAF